jgi:hypothetical protein
MRRLPVRLAGMRSRVGLRRVLGRRRVRVDWRVLIRRGVVRRLVVGHRVVVPWLCHRLVCRECRGLGVDLMVCVDLVLRHRRRLGHRRMRCDRRGGVHSMMRRLGMTSVGLASEVVILAGGRVVVLVVTMVVIKAL